MPRALLLLVVLLLGAGGPAWAQTQFREAVDLVVASSTSLEIVRWADAQITKQVSVGRYVRWGGAILIGSALIAAALDYFYHQLKRQTGTPLDQWVDWPGVPQPVWTGGESPANATEIADAIGAQCGQNFRVYPSVEVYGSPATGYAMFVRNHQGTKVANLGYRSLSQSVPWSEAYARATAEVWPLFKQYVLSVCPNAFQERPPLSDWIRQHPDAADGVRQAVTTYVDATPIGSPQSPYPGVELQPVPNPNQWTDNPFTRPDIDTDGDGWPDSVEWYEANRRGVPWPDVINNPEVHPDPNGDADGDGWTNWEEVKLGTDPYNPNSHPQSGGPTTWVDSDGDSYSDAEEIAKGTDPQNPDSHPDTPPEEKKDEVTWPGGPGPVSPAPVHLPEVNVPEKKELPRLQEWDEVAESWKRNVQDRVVQRFQELRDTLKEKFPFGILTIAQSRSVTVAGAQCVVSIEIAGQSVMVDPCDTPVFHFMEGFRSVLLGLLMLGFTYAAIRRGLDIQS